MESIYGARFWIMCHGYNISQCSVKSKKTQTLYWDWPLDSLGHFRQSKTLYVESKEFVKLNYE